MGMLRVLGVLGMRERLAVHVLLLLHLVVLVLHLLHVLLLLHLHVLLVLLVRIQVHQRV